jgi:hypothetical protein
LVLRKVVASLFVLLIVLPFTEPWSVCPLAKLCAGDAAQSELLPASTGDAHHAVLSQSPIAVAPDLANPITLLPPLRIQAGALRVSVTATIPPVMVVAIPRIARTADVVIIGSGPPVLVLPAIALILRL